MKEFFKKIKQKLNPVADKVKKVLLVAKKPLDRFAQTKVGKKVIRIVKIPFVSYFLYYITPLFLKASSLRR